MIIISKKEYSIINFDKISYIEIDDDYSDAFDEDKKYAICAVDIDSNDIELGIYETLEEAKKVLRRIYAAAVIGEKWLDLSENEEEEK